VNSRPGNSAAFVPLTFLPLTFYVSAAPDDQYPGISRTCWRILG